jgi:hypothetical protein
MRYILVLIIMNIAVMQELQVEGDLTVSGEINSAVIDSLRNEIENLQNQLNEYSGAIKTRIIELEVSLNVDENGDMSMVVPLNELIGAVNNWYKIIPLHNEIDVNSCGADIAIQSEYSYGGIIDNDISYGNYRYYFEGGLHVNTLLPIFIYDSSPSLYLYGDLNASNCSGTITLLVTSEN